MLVVVFTARVNSGLVEFIECGESLPGNRFPLNMKDKVNRCCIRSSICMEARLDVRKKLKKHLIRRTDLASHVPSDIYKQNHCRTDGHAEVKEKTVNMLPWKKQVEEETKDWFRD